MTSRRARSPRAASAVARNAVASLLDHDRDDVPAANDSDSDNNNDDVVSAASASINRTASPSSPRRRRPASAARGTAVRGYTALHERPIASPASARIPLTPDRADSSEIDQHSIAATPTINTTIDPTSLPDSPRTFIDVSAMHDNIKSSPHTMLPNTFVVTDSLQKPNIETDQSSNVAVSHLVVKGMTCTSCVAAVERALCNNQAVLSADVVLLTEQCTVRYRPSLIAEMDLVRLVDDVGFQATIAPRAAPGRIVLSVSGMTCSSCSSGIETRLKNLSGVTDVSVNLLAKTATVSFDATILGPRAIVDAIEGLGFGAVIEQRSKEQQLGALSHREESDAWRVVLVNALCLSSVVFIAMTLTNIMPSIFGFEIVAGLGLGPLIVMAFTTPIQLGVGQVFYRSAFKALRHHTFNMDVLVILGSSLAYAYSVFALVLRIVSRAHIQLPLFFETSASLITFISMGRYLENRAKGKTSEAIVNLIRLTPETANLLVPLEPLSPLSPRTYLTPTNPDYKLQDSACITNFEEKEIATNLIGVGDLLRIKPGERVPTDGQVVFGSSRIDESLITGESYPVKKEVGDQVIGGSVNGAGTLHVKATRVGSETTISHIIDLVTEAQSRKAPIQALADVVAGVFVPCVILLGTATFIAWLLFLQSTRWRPKAFADDVPPIVIALQFFIAVTVVACPCALGLATPTAVMVGTGVGARYGIIFKGGAALESAKNITKIVFDKTGTLTKGVLTVTRPIVYSHGSVTDLWMWQAARAAEVLSEHPLGKSIVKYVERERGGDEMMEVDGESLAVSNFQYFPGSGISCMVGSHSIKIGSAEFMKTFSSIPDSVTNEQLSLEHMGMTVVHLAVDDVPSLLIPMADVLKPEAVLTIRAIQNLGISCILCTGDRQLTANYVAQQCGITEVYASVSPAGKQQLVQQLQLSGEKVAMCGDGVNDSASMASSDLGIAVYGGTDIATETADVVLLRNDLQSVTVALHLARVIYSRIVFNFILASVYNLAIIPLAMGILSPFGIMLPTIVVSLAMSCSSLSVVVSSLLLTRYKPKLF